MEGAAAMCASLGAGPRFVNGKKEKEGILPVHDEMIWMMWLIPRVQLRWRGGDDEQPGCWQLRRKVCDMPDMPVSADGDVQD